LLGITLANRSQLANMRERQPRIVSLGGKLGRITPGPRNYYGNDGPTMTLTPTSNTNARDPYPFDQPSLTANLIFRRLIRTKFKDSAELQSVYFGTASQVALFQLAPAGAAH
jgi:hypothetical protein